jgi:rhodanese-related sulfurtransferase
MCSGRPGLRRVAHHTCLSVSTVMVLCGCVPMALLRPTDLPAARQAVRQHFPEVAQVSCAELNDLLIGGGGGGAVVLDIRTAEEFDVSHLPGARRFEVGEKLDDVPRDARIVVYCSVGYRSSQAARMLLRSGRGNVANLDGGIFQWSGEGRELLDSAGRPTRSVHPYNAQWARLLNAPPAYRPLP